MKNEQAQRIIAEHFSKKVRKDPKICNAYLLVHSDKLGVHLNIAEGSADHAVNANQPYFIASIGKLFTSVLIGILVEKAMISYEDPLHPYIDPDLLHNLHIYKGKDYTKIRVNEFQNDPRLDAQKISCMGKCRFNRNVYVLSSGPGRLLDRQFKSLRFL
ncbi:serine hydrolase [Paenibacillus thermoaerophilus]|uniref:Serine hydrolase n=1 Tax=Paenibacillus thermoaerophilus TaxID=1215385 RepID=A0ABW2V5P2_9BACL|nr:serine hydrolase [Paenibacillus thermoaerophilus]